VICTGGTGAGGRGTFADGAIAAGGGGGEMVVVALTRLPRASPDFGSADLTSDRRSSLGFVSASRGSDTSASTGRRGGNRKLEIEGPAAGMCTTEPNIGAGCGPCCRNSALVMMAPAAVKASRPATISFGLCRKTRIRRPRSDSSSTAAAAAPRRRRRGVGISSSSSAVTFLGTSLHLDGLVLVRSRRPRRGRQRRDLVRRQFSFRSDV